jgi:predicted nucleic acid-binding protein
LGVEHGTAAVNSLPLFCLDTHAIHWRRIASPKLSTAATQVYQDAIDGKAILIVHYVVIAELFYLLTKYGQPALFAPLIADFKSLPYYRIEPVTLPDLDALDSLTEIPEMHDRLLALAAKRLGATVVTKDPSIQASPQVNCLW